MNTRFLLASTLTLFSLTSLATTIILNKDGSITAQDITVMRGDKIYPIAFDSGLPYESTCAMLGYDASLKADGLNTNAVYEGNAVLLKTQGTFQKTINTGKRVAKVTCIKTDQHKMVTQFDQSPNPDGSIKITNIKILRGDLAYPIAANYDTVFDSVCKLVGFDASLGGAELNEYITDQSPKAHIRPDGSYDSMAPSNFVISKATCYLGNEPAMIIFIGGNTYQRIVPYN